MAIGVALIGCGNRGVNALAACVRGSQRLRLVAVCDVDPARAAQASQRLGVPAVADYTEVVQRQDVDAVLIATDARSHVAVGMAAVEAKKHLFVEKPLADDPLAARRLAAAARAAGLVGLVGYQFRASPFAAALKRELPTIAPVQALLTAQRVPLNPQFFFPEHYGGIVDFATHTIHLALWAMDAPPEGVVAHIRRGTIRGDGTIEFMSLVIDFAGGTRSATIVSSMFGVEVPNLYSFVGTRGTLSTLDQRVLKVATHDGVGEPGARTPPGLQVRTVEAGRLGDRDETGALLEHFAALVAGEADRAHPLGCTLEEGAEAVAVSAAMVRAAESGQRVVLNRLG